MTKAEEIAQKLRDEIHEAVRIIRDHHFFERDPLTRDDMALSGELRQAEIRLIAAALESAIKEERKRCAKIAETCPLGMEHTIPFAADEVRKVIAARIRADATRREE